MPTDRAADDLPNREYAKALGNRLRAARTDQHLTLHGVERKSDGRWKAVVIGSYERGDRAISVHRLVELAAFYDVPVARLLPDTGAPAAVTTADVPLARVVLNVRRVHEVAAADPDAAALARLVTAMQSRRGGHAAETLAIRRDDLSTLALIYDTSEHGVTDRLVRWQVLTPESVILDSEP